MLRLLITLIAATGLFVALTSIAMADSFPGASGMAYMGGGDYLVAQDTKVTTPGPRIGVLHVAEGGAYDYQPIEVDWPVRAANDLESVYGFKTRPGEFLLCESGSYFKQWDDPTSEEYPGRIFHLRVSRVGDGWAAEVLMTFDIPLHLHEVEGMFAMKVNPASSYMGYGVYPGMGMSLYGEDGEDSPSMDDEYAMAMQAYGDTMAAAQPAGDGTIIALATRGGTTPYEPAVIYWGYVDLENGSFELSMEGSVGTELSQSGSYSPLQTASPWRRGCTDLYMDANGILWVATSEEQADAGPFRSTVYRYGSFDPFGYASPFAYMDYGYSSGWTIDGLKIEALAGPCIDGTVLCFATDDEDYGGVWRPLGAP